MKSFRYGTSIMPSVVKGIIGRLPESLAPVHPNEFTDSTRDEFLRNLSTGERLSAVRGGKQDGRMPSVSAVIGATDDVTKLYRWQFRMVQEMGFTAFKSHMAERTKSGTNFHSTVKNLLDVLQKEGTLSDDAVAKVLATAYPQNVGYIRGILPVVRGLRATPWMRMEKSTANFHYCYQGRFDAIVEIHGKPTLVDWKTVSAGSVKSTEVNPEGTKPEQLYGNPLQIAAYVAAVNTDARFADVPKIEQGAIVLTYEDGRDAEIVVMDSECLEEYNVKLGERLNTFWWRLMNPSPDDVDVMGNVNFVYNSVMARLAESAEKAAAAEAVAAATVTAT